MRTQRFAAAGPDEEIVYGACRPGRFDDRTGPTAVTEWIAFMQQHGIDRVCCLLAAPDEGDPRLLERYRTAFGPEQVQHVPITDFDVVDSTQFHDRICPFLREADQAAEPTVVHCSAGSGRTGHVLALWLVHGRGYDLRRAVETVRATGRKPLEAATMEELRAI